jgi:hypothetical protein
VHGRRSPGALRTLLERVARLQVDYPLRRISDPTLEDRLEMIGFQLAN